MCAGGVFVSLPFGGVQCVCVCECMLVSQSMHISLLHGSSRMRKFMAAYIYLVAMTGMYTLCDEAELSIARSVHESMFREIILIFCSRFSEDASSVADYREAWSYRILVRGSHHFGCR